VPNVLLRNAWALVFRGLLAVFLGLSVFAWPDFTTRALVFLFGAYAVGDGAFGITAAVWAGEWHMRRWPLLAEGVASIVAGGLVWVWPAMTEFVLLHIIAAWATVTGIFEIVATVLLPLERTTRWLLALNGAASVLFGLLLLVAFPGSGALAIVWLLGVYANVFGILLLVFTFRLRRLSHLHVPATV
jgi:uncharacterized membrane protein HdeD (DUF308 family)